MPYFFLEIYHVDKKIIGRGDGGDHDAMFVEFGDFFVWTLVALYSNALLETCGKWKDWGLCGYWRNL